MDDAHMRTRETTFNRTYEELKYIRFMTLRNHKELF